MALVAVVVQVGGVVSTAEVSPFTKPAKLGVMVGAFAPYVMDPLLAVIVSVAFAIVTVPAT